MPTFLALQAFNKMSSQITACAWTPDGQMLAYAASYDWSKGHADAGKSQPQIFLRGCKDEEIRPRPKQAAAVGRR